MSKKNALETKLYDTLQTYISESRQTDDIDEIEDLADHSIRSLLEDLSLKEQDVQILLTIFDIQSRRLLQTTLIGLVDTMRHNISL